jgi:hypothetical protein
VAQPHDEAVTDSKTMKIAEPEDMVKFGLIPEFIGRFPVQVSQTDTHAMARNICSYPFRFRFEEALCVRDPAACRIDDGLIRQVIGLRGQVKGLYMTAWLRFSGLLSAALLMFWHFL